MTVGITNHRWMVNELVQYQVPRLLTLGLVPLAVAGAGVTLPTLVSALGMAGLGLGLSSAGLQTAAVEAVDVRETGVAAGIFSTSRYFGSIVGSSVLAGLLGTQHEDSSGFTAVFLLVVVAAAGSATAGLGLPGLRERNRLREESPA